MARVVAGLNKEGAVVSNDYRIKEMEAVDLIGIELVTSAESIAAYATAALDSTTA